MDNSNKIQLFEDKRIRTAWDTEKEEWYFSIVDVIAVLADNYRPRKYWGDLKFKLKAEGSELSEKIGQLNTGLAQYPPFMAESSETKRNGSQRLPKTVSRNPLPLGRGDSK